MGRLELLGASKPLVVTDPGIVASGLLDQLLGALGDLPHAVFDETLYKLNSVDVDWEGIALMQCPKRMAIECRAQWCAHTTPRITRACAYSLRAPPGSPFLICTVSCKGRSQRDDPHVRPFAPVTRV